jgi:hypothetical protein
LSGDEEDRFATTSDYWSTPTVNELIRDYKFPYQTGNEQFKVVDEICQDENLFAMVEFYYLEPIEF